MSALHLIRRLSAKIADHRHRNTAIDDDQRAAVESAAARFQMPESLDTLEDFLALERQLFGDAYPDSFTSTPAPTVPAVRHRSFRVPRGRTGRALSACWDTEDEISTLLKKLAPGVFTDWMPRDWQLAITLAPTPWLKHLVRLGAAVRVRRLELSCRGHDFKSARDTYRDITQPQESSPESDAQDLLSVRELLATLNQAPHPTGRRRPDSCPGPPRSKRLTRTRPTRTRRGGHGASPHAGVRTFAASATTLA